MAVKGLRKFLYNELNEEETGYNEEEPKVLALACSVKVSLGTNSEAMYADDEKQYEDNSITSIGITIEGEDDALEIFAPILGKSSKKITINDEETEEVISSTNDIPKRVGFGYIEARTSKRKGDYYRAKVYKKVTFKDFETDSETKGEKTTFKKPTIEGTGYPIDGDWKWEADFINVENAVAYILKKLKQTNFKETEEVSEAYLETE